MNAKIRFFISCPLVFIMFLVVGICYLLSVPSLLIVPRITKQLKALSDWIRRGMYPRIRPT